MSERYIDGAGQSSDAELPKLNIDLLRECADWASYRSGLHGQPLWNQGNWHGWVRKGFAHYVNGRKREEGYCGTSFCVAGYAVHAAGWSEQVGPLLEQGLISEDRVESIYGCEYGDDVVHATELTNPAMIGYDGTMVAPHAKHWGHISWGQGAQKLLGLTDWEAGALFNGDNTIRQVRNTCKAIAESRGMEL